MGARIICIPVDTDEPLVSKELDDILYPAFNNALAEMEFAAGNIAYAGERVWIEVVGVRHDIEHLADTMMIADEEGLLKHLPFNRRASNLALRNIVGPALIVGYGRVEEDDFDIIGLADEVTIEMVTEASNG
jgi:hypothetical protein